MQIQVNVSEKELSRLFDNMKSIDEVLVGVVQELATKIREFAVQRTPIGENWVRGVGWKRSGRMKNSWSPVFKTGSSWSFTNSVPYANVVEEGLYPGIGTRRQPPRTVASGGRIYSSQAIGGIVKPIIDGSAGAESSIKHALEQALRELRSSLGS